MSRRAWLTHIFILLLIGLCIRSFFFFHRHTLTKGMLIQMWPDHLVQLGQIRTHTADTAALILHSNSFLAYINPDFPTYITPRVEMIKCLHEKKKLTERVECIIYWLSSYRKPLYGLLSKISAIIYDTYSQNCIITKNCQYWKTHNITSKDILILIQILFSILSSLLVAIIVFYITKSQITMYVSYILYQLLWFVIRYDYLTGTESLNTSLMIIASYFLTKTFLYRSPKYALLAGLFLLGCYLLRPLSIVLYPIWIIALIYQSQYFQNAPINSSIMPSFIKELAYRYKSMTTKIILSFMLISFLYITIESVALTISNGKLTLISRNTFYGGEEQVEYGSLFLFSSAYGDNWTWFYHSSYHIPKRAYVSKYNDSTEKIIIDFYKKLQHRKVIEVFNDWRNTIKSEKPILHYGTRYLYLALNFFISHPLEQLYYARAALCEPIYAITYILSAFLWTFSLGIGFIASIYYLIYWRKHLLLATFSLSAHAAWASYVALSSIQSRYMLFALPFFFILSVTFVHQLCCRKSPTVTSSA